MTGLIIAAGVLGSIYLAILIFCVLQVFDFFDVKTYPFWAIALAFFNAFKTSIIVFFWVLVGIAWFAAMISPLFLSCYFCGFFN